MWNINNEAQVQSEDPYKEDKEKLFKEIDEKREEIFNLVDQYTDSDVSGDLKELISKGFQVYVGGRIVNFEISSVEELPADRLKEDIKQQFREKLEQIKQSINEKLYSLSESYESLREKLDDELQKAQETSNFVPMPEVNESHARRGLSVVRGSSSNELVWLYSGYYCVRTVDGYPISDDMRKKTLKPVTVKIVTKDNKVTSVKLKKFNKLNNFRHYHSMDSDTDCWGDWDYHIKWEYPEDIINVGEDALTILNDVNTDSPGSTQPPGLPNLDELISNSRNEQSQRNREHQNESENPADFLQELDADVDQRNNYVWTTS